MTTSTLRRAAVAAAVIGVIAATAVLYGKKPGGKETAGACPTAAATVARLGPFEKGEVAAAVSQKQPAPVVSLDFLGPDGKPVSTADFRGKVVLVNLWATWCVPCREEMPSLDKLQQKLGSKDFQVVAINIDTTRPQHVRDFLRDTKIVALPFYSDPKADTFYRLKTAGKVVGLPTSFLVDRDGCELALMAGPANWASDDAMALIKTAL
ncbi:MAG: TlpA family protein disulfide reductase [Hyphomicrobiales bacterium]|nr:TlpA family protein disulfide reductase [Hyphomicrobiales bacterium]